MKTTDKLTFTITAEQMAYMSSAVIDRDRLKRELSEAVKALQGKREALRCYQAICERNKISVAGATGKPQVNETNAAANVGAVLVGDHETEGRVSGGDRAGTTSEFV